MLCVGAIFCGGVGCTGTRVETRLVDINGDSAFALALTFNQLPDTIDTWLGGGGGATLTLNENASCNLGLCADNDDGIEDVCAVLGPETVATANGVTLTAMSLGSINTVECPECKSPRRVCVYPSWTIADAEFHSATLDLQLTDASGSLGATFVGINERPSAALVGLDNGVAHGGQTVTVAFSPATDEILDAWVNLEPDNCCDLETFGESTHSASFVVPSEFSGAGETGLSVDIYGFVGTSRCDVGFCQAELKLSTATIPFRVE